MTFHGADTAAWRTICYGPYLNQCLTTVSILYSAVINPLTYMPSLERNDSMRVQTRCERRLSMERSSLRESKMEMRYNLGLPLDVEIKQNAVNRYLTHFGLFSRILRVHKDFIPCFSLKAEARYGIIKRGNRSDRSKIRWTYFAVLLACGTFFVKIWGLCHGTRLRSCSALLESNEKPLLASVSSTELYAVRADMSQLSLRLLASRHQHSYSEKLATTVILFLPCTFQSGAIFAKWNTSQRRPPSLSS